MTSVNWLPDLVPFETYGGNWNKYVNALYDFYKKDFIEDKPTFRGKKLRIRKYPQFKNKDRTFWHIIQEGKIEVERIPDIRRCERIRWPKPMIEHYNYKEIKTWEDYRRGEIRICIWFESVDYLVVLAKRKKYILFLTSYPTDRNHTRRKLLKACERYYKKTGVAPKDDTDTPSTHGR